MNAELTLGSIIANNLDPKCAGFICGTVISMAGDELWIRLADGGRALILSEDAVSLMDVVRKNPTTSFIMDRRMWDKEQIFAGGIKDVETYDKYSGRYAIKVPQGVIYMNEVDSLFL